MYSVKTRVISLSLCLVMLLGMIPAFSITASAAANGEPSLTVVTGSPRDLSAFSQLDAKLSSLSVDTSLVEKAVSAIGKIIDKHANTYGTAQVLLSNGIQYIDGNLQDQIDSMFWSVCAVFTWTMNLRSSYEVLTYPELREFCFNWPGALQSSLNSLLYQVEKAYEGAIIDELYGDYVQAFFKSAFALFPQSVNVIWDSSIAGYRLYFPDWNLYYCDVSANYPFYIPATDSPDADNGVDQSDPESYSTDQWRSEALVTEPVGTDYRWHFIPYTTMTEKLHEWAGSPDGSVSIWDYGDFWALRMQISGVNKNNSFVLCDDIGQPYYVPDPSVTAASNRTDNINSETGEINIDLLLDLDARLTHIENEISLLGDVTYNPDTRTYYVEANRDYTFNTENNYYEYYTYYYTFNYYYEYTYITNIGTTGEYKDETYTYYYELPDGRSSADLTAEELAQLNVFMDVVGYVASTDDTRLRALYHFDGNIEDSSFWSAHGGVGFEWIENASITYLDAGVFNGCLYLDELSHKFQINLPSAIGSDDFTVSFRLYQQAEPLDGSTGYIQLGSDGLNSAFQAITFDGTNYYMGGTTVATPGGTWTEILLQRIDGTIYYYLNGLRVASVACANAFDSAIVFYFPADTGGYHYLDELRVLNFAAHSSLTVQYSPTSVPYDSNAALVLPDSAVPVADEYWSISSSKTNMLEPYDLDVWYDATGVTSDYLVATPFTYAETASSGVGSAYVNGTYVSKCVPIWYVSSSSFYGNTCFPYFMYNPTVSGDYSFVDSTSFPRNYSYDLLGVYFNGNTSRPCLPACGIYSEIYSSSSWYSPLTNESYYLDSGSYCLSMVDADGNVGSIPFTVPDIGYSHFSRNSVNSFLVKVTNCGSFNGYSLKLFYSSYGSYISGDYYATNKVYLALVPDSNAGEFVYLELCEGSSTDLTAEYVSSVVALDADSLNSPTLAVRYNNQLLSGSYNIGGVRPSIPEDGDVWCLVENGIITSIQVYTGYAWESCDGRIWTGSRWVPYNAYNIITQADLWDITDGTPGKTYIYTSEGFWAWFEEAWRSFIEMLTDRLDRILVYLSADDDDSGGGNDLNPDDFPGDSGSEDPDDDYTIVQLITTLADGTWKVVTGVVRIGADGFSSFVTGIENIGGFFDAYDQDNTGGVFYVPLEDDGS